MNEKITRALVLLSDDLSISFMRLQAVLDNHRTDQVKAEDELVGVAENLHALANALEALAAVMKADE